MSSLTQEEVRDEVLSLFEDNEKVLLSYLSLIETIEDQGMMDFEMKIIAAKNKIIQNEAIKDDDIEAVYLKEVEEIRKKTLEDISKKITDVVREKTEAK